MRSWLEDGRRGRRGCLFVSLQNLERIRELSMDDTHLETTRGQCSMTRETTSLPPASWHWTHKALKARNSVSRAPEEPVPPLSSDQPSHSCLLMLLMRHSFPESCTGGSDWQSLSHILHHNWKRSGEKKKKNSVMRWQDTNVGNYQNAYKSRNNSGDDLEPLDFIRDRSSLIKIRKRKVQCESL